MQRWRTRQHRLSDFQTGTGKEDLLRYLLCNNYEDISFINGNFSHVDKNGHDENVSLDQQQTETLYEALKQISLPETILPDLESMTRKTTRLLRQFYFYGQYRETLNTWQTCCHPGSQQIHPGYYKAAPINAANTAVQNTRPENYYSSIEVSFSLSKSCTNTIQAMIDLGLIKSASDLITQDAFYAMINTQG